MANIIKFAKEFGFATLYSIGQINSFSRCWLPLAPLYARMKYGIGPHSYMLYSLYEIPLRIWPDYLNNEEFKKQQKDNTTPAQRHWADNKLEFYQHCVKHSIETPPVLCKVAVANLPTDPFKDSVTTAEQLEQVLDDGYFFIKPQSGSHGVGAGAFIVKGDEVDAAAGLCTKQVFVHTVMEKVKSGVSFIIQKKLFNHPTIRQLTGSPHLSTVRVVTVLQDGKVTLVGSFFRIIAGSNEIDSFQHGASGNLIASVDVSNGRLIYTKCCIGKTLPVMDCITAHPTTKVSFVDFQLPEWSAVQDLVTRAHLSISPMLTVGWDVAITDQGVFLMEANWRYDVDAMQVAYSTGFKTKFIDYYPGC